MDHRVAAVDERGFVSGCQLPGDPFDVVVHVLESAPIAGRSIPAAAFVPLLDQVADDVAPNESSRSRDGYFHLWFSSLRWQPNILQEIFRDAIRHTP